MKMTMKFKISRNLLDSNHTSAITWIALNNNSITSKVVNEISWFRQFKSMGRMASPTTGSWSSWWAKLNGSAVSATGAMMRSCAMVSVRPTMICNCKTHYLTDIRDTSASPTYRWNFPRVGGTPMLIRDPFQATSQSNCIHLSPQALGATDLFLHQKMATLVFRVRYRLGMSTPGQEFWILQASVPYPCSRARRKVGPNASGRLGDIDITPSSPQVAALSSYVVPGSRTPLPP